MNNLEDFLLKAITYGVFSPPFFFSMIPLCFPSGVKPNKDTLYGIKQDGTIMFSFSSGDFRRPIGVAAAVNGNLYVTAQTLTFSVDNVYYTFIPQYYVIVY
jgi:hypothetical protein